MADCFDVFLSYSRNDLDAATLLRTQLEQQGLKVFRDQDSIREGDRWLDQLQGAVEACRGFVLLVGRDGVQRWVGAEAQVALTRHFGPHDEAERLPIFPILLGDATTGSLPAFLRLFQTSAWNGVEPLPETLLGCVKERRLLPTAPVAFEGCPFVGLDAYRPDQAHLFFGRRKETLDALTCFDTRHGSAPVRWLEINGNSGAGKSSLMNAGLLPLIDQGWLWPRTGFEQWRRIGPMLPGAHPAAMLAEHLARAFGQEMSEVRRQLEGDERALAEWLRGRKPDDQTAFLLAIDQFEELFTFADADERRQFDRLLAHALADIECPLFLVSTVRSDFLDRFDALLPRLLPVRNRLGRLWTLPLIGREALREVIDGPARLAGLNVDEIRAAILAEVQDEPGALPLVENALSWLWQRRQDGRLSGQLLTDQGGVAGILSQSADALLWELDGASWQRRRSWLAPPWLAAMVRPLARMVRPARLLGQRLRGSLGGQRMTARDRALELLCALVNIDPEWRRHTRRRIAYDDAVALAGDGEAGGALVHRLAGGRSPATGHGQGAMRLITLSGDAAGASNGAGPGQRWVSLIHETLVRSKGVDDQGQPQPYWPTLWQHLKLYARQATRRDGLLVMAREWQTRSGVGRLFGLASWTALLGARRVGTADDLLRRYLRWSKAAAVVQALLLLAIMGVVGDALHWKVANEQQLEAVWIRWAYLLGKDLPMPKLVTIPAGSFTMGSEQNEVEMPPHPVTIANPPQFSPTEVTFGQFDAFARATGRQLPDDSGRGRGDRPVINVDWCDAQAYARWLGAMTGQACRLPSEAEWEYACRAGTTTEYALPAPHGSNDIRGRGWAVCPGCQPEGADNPDRTAPVTGAGRPANSWGLHDMHGNALEWVADCWHGSYNGAPDDGSAWTEAAAGYCIARVLRGGSWFNKRDGARCAVRKADLPYGRFPFIGFRVVCSATSSPFLPGPACSSARRAAGASAGWRRLLPALSADHGSRTEARAGRWRGLVPSAPPGQARRPGA